jgi:para-nitrobenzyl esterase
MKDRTRRIARRGTTVAVALGLAATGTVAVGHHGAGATARARTDAAVVVTDRGPVRGVVDRDIRAFRGIPYAQPPTGALRWRPPRPAAQWQGYATRAGRGRGAGDPQGRRR